MDPIAKMIGSSGRRRPQLRLQGFQGGGCRRRCFALEGRSGHHRFAQEGGRGRGGAPCFARKGDGRRLPSRFVQEGGPRPHHLRIAQVGVGSCGNSTATSAP